MITDDKDRSLNIEFVLPGHRHATSLDDLDQHRQHHAQPIQQQTRGIDHVLDLSVNRPTSVPIIQPKKGPASWMD